MEYASPMKSRLSVVQVVSVPAAVAGHATGITGPERRAANLASQWKDQGIDVTVLYPRRGALWDQFARSGVALVDFEVRSKWDWRSLNRIAEEVRRTDARVVHTQGGPAVDLAGVYAARRTGAAAVLTRPVMIEDQIDRSSLATLLARAVDRVYTIAKADAVVTVSRDGFNRMKRRISGGKLHLIHNGVKPIAVDHEQRRQRDTTCTEVQIGMVGHLLNYKGWDVFLRVAQRLSGESLKVRWHVIGEGSERARLEDMARAFGIQEKVVFHGLVQEVHKVLVNLDVFVLTSRREGLSVAVLEAMSACLPVVATDVAGIRDQVTDGVNGYVTPVDDVDMIVDRCRSLIELPEERVRMGRNSRVMMERNFSESAMLNRYVALYRDVASTRVADRR